MTYKQAPLPFVGQKRNFLTHFKTLLNQHLNDDGEGWVIVDAFGGSGLLAHTAKQLKPKARVIYNDYEGYSEKLKHIEDINTLRAKLASILTNEPRQRRLSQTARVACESIIRSFGGYIDLNSLSTWLLFSGRQVASLKELFEQNWYNTIRKSDYPNAVGYLDGLEITHQSYDTLLPQFIDNPKALFVLDPPYVNTNQTAYRQNNYFGMVEFLRLMNMVRPPFIFFSSTRSEILDYLNLVINEQLDGFQRFEGYQYISQTTSINYDARYEDNIIYRFE